MDAGGGLLGDALHARGDLLPEFAVLLADVLQDGEHGLFVGGFRHGLQKRGIKLAFHAHVDQPGGVAAVVHDLVRAFAVRPDHRLHDELPVFGDAFAFVGEDGDAAFRDGGGRVVLRGEDVAGAPAEVGAEFGEGFDEDRGLDGHVQAAHDADPGERFGFAVLFAERHEAGHFVLGDLDLLASEVGESDVADEVFAFCLPGCFRGHCEGSLSLIAC